MPCAIVLLVCVCGEGGSRGLWGVHFFESHSYQNSLPGVEVDYTELCLGGRYHDVVDGFAEVVDRAVGSGVGGIGVEVCAKE